LAGGDGTYFVEFHARQGLTVFGHTYIVYGRLNARGTIVARHVVGFSDGDNGTVRLYAARGLVGPLKRDLSHLPTASYRRHLTPAQFFQLNLKIVQIQQAQPPYHLFFFNCTDFAGEIAEAIGLRRPPGLMVPTAYVVWLRALNGP
jgi:hypothetical protein